MIVDEIAQPAAVCKTYILCRTEQNIDQFYDLAATRGLFLRMFGLQAEEET